MTSYTLALGHLIQGDTGDPAGVNGLVMDDATGAFIDPSLSVWRETGAPFGSPQTVHSATGLPPGVSIAQGGVRPSPDGYVDNFGLQGKPTRRGVYTGTFAASGVYAGDSFTVTISGTPPSLTSLTPDVGTWEGGTPVTILGLGFSAVVIDAVLFGRQPATSVVVVNDTTITCVTPSAGNGPVVVEVTLDVETTGRHLFFAYEVPAIGDYEVRESPGIYITDQRNDAPSSAQFTVQTTEPACGQGCRIIDPATRRTLHTGSIVRSQSVIRPPDIAWGITATDFSWLLNRRRPFGTYSPTVLSPPAAVGATGTKGVPADVIAQDLLARFATGFTGNRITPGLPEVTITFDGTQTFTACLAALCAAAGGLVFALDVRDLVLGYDVGIVVAEDDFSGNATFPTRDGFIGDGSTVTFALTKPLINPYWPYVVPDYYAIITEQNQDPSLSSPLLWANVATFRQGRLGLKSPAQVPAAPVLATTAWLGASGPYDPYNLYHLRHMYLRVAFLFSDGTESFVGPRSAITDVLKTEGWTATIPTGGAGVVGRRIYMSAAIGNLPFVEEHVMDVLDNATTTVAATGASPLVDYSNVGLVFIGSGTTGYGNYPFGFPYPNGISGETGVLWQYDPATNSITKGAATIGFDGTTQSYIEPPVPTPDDGGFWRISISYSASNVAATATFPLTHPLVPTPGTGLIGLGFVTYNDGRGPVNETLTAVGGGGVWTWNSGTNAITRTTGVPVTPQPVLDSTGHYVSAKNISIIYSTNNGVYAQVVDARLLLFDPAPSKTVDITQLRNRFLVHAVGTTLRVAAGAGAMSLALNESMMFLAGGQALIGTDVVDLDVVVYGAVPAVSIMAPTLRAYAAGTPVRLRLQVEDLASQADRAAIEGGDGVHEGILDFTSWLIGSDIVETAPGVRAAAEAAALTARGETALATWSGPQVTIAYATRDPNTRSGSLVTFDRPELGFVGTFKIQDVAIDQINIAKDGDQILVPRFTVSASEIRLGFDDLLRKVLLAGDGGAAGSGGGSGSATGGGGGGTPAVPEYRGEVPSGAIPGSDFALAHVARASTLMLYRNGLRQFEGPDYTMTTASTFTMIAALTTGDRLVADYRGY